MLMKKISGQSTFYYKRVLPLLLLALPLIFLSVALFASPVRPPLLSFLPPLLLVPFVYLLMRKLIWDLADEVWDGGDHLVVKIGDQSESVPLSNIMNVSASTLVNPPRITLRLVSAGRFGQEISFSPPRNSIFNPFARNVVADDLIERVHRAKPFR
jgi:hypothetical protein